MSDRIGYENNIRNVCSLAAGRIAYQGTMHRLFGEDTSAVTHDLIDKGYFTEYISYHCPYCDFALFNNVNPGWEENFQNGRCLCYACDREFLAGDIETEPLLVRTEKLYTGEQVPANEERRSFYDVRQLLIKSTNALFERIVPESVNRFSFASDVSVDHNGRTEVSVKAKDIKGNRISMSIVISGFELKPAYLKYYDSGDWDIMEQEIGKAQNEIEAGAKELVAELIEAVNRVK